MEYDPPDDGIEATRQRDAVIASLADMVMIARCAHTVLRCAKEVLAHAQPPRIHLEFDRCEGMSPQEANREIMMYLDLVEGITRCPR